MDRPLAFLAYSRLDEAAAQRLHDDLEVSNVLLWFDKVNLPGGAKWREVIADVIRTQCRFFLLMLSQRSVNRRGFVNKEITIALDVIDEFQPDSSFVIPLRLEECTPKHPKLNDLHWVELFPDWDDGVYAVLRTIAAADIEMSLPQRVRWGPVDGQPPGIIVLSGDRDFVPWVQLKPEIESGLLNQFRNVPPGSHVELWPFRGKENWIVRIIGPDGHEVGDLWLGPDPEKHWRFDGLVRAGPCEPAKQIAWQTFQRYSDGTYRRRAMSRTAP